MARVRSGLRGTNELKTPLGRRSVLPPTPGEFLRELMRSTNGVTQDRLASAMGVSRLTVSQLVNDHRTVTPEMALRLGKALDTSPDVWLNLQQHVELNRAARKLKRMLPRIEPLRRTDPTHGDPRT